MSVVVAGLGMPATPVVEAAERVAGGMLTPAFLEHSRRVYLFARLHAERLGLRPRDELLYLAAVFHDTGLLTPVPGPAQRFEVDGADHALSFLRDHGVAEADAETVWTAIALHTTPGIPGRMGPEIATLHFGVLTDVIGFGLDVLDPGRVHDVLAAHPRGDFGGEFLATVARGLGHRPETANGTVNADILEHCFPDLRLTTTVERIATAEWPE